MSVSRKENFVSTVEQVIASYDGVDMQNQILVQHLFRHISTCGVAFTIDPNTYYWKKRLSDPAPKIKELVDNVILFREYHLKYPLHGCRWLSAKIRLDTGLEVSDTYAHKCCKIARHKKRGKALPV